MCNVGHALSRIIPTCAVLVIMECNWVMRSHGRRDRNAVMFERVVREETAKTQIESDKESETLILVIMHTTLSKQGKRLYYVLFNLHFICRI